ncbi:hypothetical protein CDD81_4587 [Ophiocordyceps australis]|uniref:Uncharacterized protein n=1 Tax=Ophiocordyceps australis TaxID=1399860 RepID=A0A2C5XV16_9HYPO|nr:hypothetical protein CDD81_4587 [Ophiocordyceps australis]
MALASWLHHKRGPWATVEDSSLLDLVFAHGPLNWVRISQTLGSRTPKQCRERYHQNLKPSLRHDPITPSEGQEIERLVQQIGKRWAEIARHLHGRSDNAVKNWWNGNQNRLKRSQRRRANQGYAHQSHAATTPTLPSRPNTSLPSIHSIRPRLPSLSSLTDEKQLAPPTRPTPQPDARLWQPPLHVNLLTRPSSPRLPQRMLHQIPHRLPPEPNPSPQPQHSTARDSRMELSSLLL